MILPLLATGSLDLVSYGCNSIHGSTSYAYIWNNLICTKRNNKHRFFTESNYPIQDNATNYKYFICFLHAWWRHQISENVQQSAWLFLITTVVTRWTGHRGPTEKFYFIIFMFLLLLLIWLWLLLLLSLLSMQSLSLSVSSSSSSLSWWLSWWLSCCHCIIVVLVIVVIRDSHECIKFSLATSSHTRRAKPCFPIFSMVKKKLPNGQWPPQICHCMNDTGICTKHI